MHDHQKAYLDDLLGQTQQVAREITSYIHSPKSLKRDSILPHSREWEMALQS